MKNYGDVQHSAIACNSYVMSNYQRVVHMRGLPNHSYLAHLVPEFGYPTQLRLPLWRWYRNIRNVAPKRQIVRSYSRHNMAQPWHNLPISYHSLHLLTTATLNLVILYTPWTPSWPKVCRELLWQESGLLVVLRAGKVIVIPRPNVVKLLYVLGKAQLDTSGPLARTRIYLQNKWIDLMTHKS